MTSLSSSLEDYLETILEIGKQTNKVRVTDISLALKVEKSSVNYAINKLKNLNLVLHENYEDITLTSQGLAKAKQVKNRHDILYHFLNTFLGISPNEAEKDACKIEHAVSCNTIEKLFKFVEFLEKSPHFNNENWLKSFSEYIEKGDSALLNMKVH